MVIEGTVKGAFGVSRFPFSIFYEKRGSRLELLRASQPSNHGGDSWDIHISVLTHIINMYIIQSIMIMHI